jgi:hypothetical protein
VGKRLEHEVKMAGKLGKSALVIPVHDYISQLRRVLKIRGDSIHFSQYIATFHKLVITLQLHKIAGTLQVVCTNMI